ncbi:unnamed protein product [Phytophthora lilii]|uniref:Unnamed protein product n=1 Tax=Phytophthora lilii TaxID=2077276 RepID=A0A9W6U2Y2_9STRA|nr:unnamed protein product [Phytophthora lilii]
MDKPISEDMQEKLSLNRAGTLLKTLSKDKLIRLERAIVERSDTGMIEMCIQVGILTGTIEKPMFSSSMMLHLFMKMCIGSATLDIGSEGDHLI